MLSLRASNEHLLSVRVPQEDCFLYFLLPHRCCDLQKRLTGGTPPPSPEGTGHNLPQLAAVALREQRRSAYCSSRFGRVYGLRASKG
jgi:hypothetical protein